MRARAADVYQAAELLGPAVRVEIRIADGGQVAEQARVRVYDLHVLRVVLRYPGARTGQHETGQRWIQSCKTETDDSCSGLADARD